MRKLRRAGLFILLGVVFGSLAYYALRPREPVYQGRPLSSWLQDVVVGVPEEKRVQAEDAFRYFGTNAILPLLRILRSEDSKLQLQYRDLSEQLLQRTFRFPPAYERHWQVVSAFRVLGPVANSAVPALTELLNTALDPISSDAAKALAYIGAEAIAPLKQALTNSNHSIRSHAAFVLGLIRPRAQTAVPDLIICLIDEHYRVRWAAASSLGKIGQKSEIVVPALMESFQKDKTPLARRGELIALMAFKENAQAAVPLLLKALEDGDAEIRVLATNVLQEVAPEALQKAGIK